MGAVSLHLEPTPWSSCSARRFAFDPETQEFSGPDGEVMRGFVARYQEQGYATPAPCVGWPVGERITLQDLTAIIAGKWITPPELPALPMRRPEENFDPAIRGQVCF